jgi:hypothetical protein
MRMRVCYRDFFCCEKSKYKKCLGNAHPARYLDCVGAWRYNYTDLNLAPLPARSERRDLL